MLPDFGSDQFLAQVEWFKRSERLYQSYLLSITALLQGMTVQFYRSQAEAGTNIKLFSATFDRSIFFSIESRHKTIFFFGSNSERDYWAVQHLQDNKSILKALLHKSNINTPFGGAVNANDKRVLTALRNATVPLVTVKPITGIHSKGVQLRQTLAQAEATIASNPTSAFIVEQHINGTEFRVTASKTKVIAAQKVAPAYVVGDGVATLKQLVEREGAARNRNPARRSRPASLEVIARSAAAKGWDGNTVLPKGEVFYYAADNITSTQFRIPVLDQLPQNVRNCAIATVRATKAAFITMDIVVDYAGEPYVVDVDSSCAMSMECFPYPNGEWNLTVPEYILKHHFPRHKRVDRVIKSYDYAALNEELFREGRTSKGVNAADFVEFG